MKIENPEDDTHKNYLSTRVGSTRANRGFNPKYDSGTYLGILTGNSLDN